MHLVVLIPRRQLPFEGGQQPLVKGSGGIEVIRCARAPSGEQQTQEVFRVGGQNRISLRGRDVARTDHFGHAAKVIALIERGLALLLQVFGDGPVKLAVAEVQPDFGLRATATVIGDIAPQASLTELVNLANQGKCAITLDPKDKFPGQQAYQGVVPLSDGKHQKFGKLSEVLEHYMLQSEQLDTTLVLAASDSLAAGLLIQRVPLQGVGNLVGQAARGGNEAGSSNHEDYRRIALLAASLKPEELLTLDADTVLRRLFWQENLLRFDPVAGAAVPHFSCTCSRERVAKMIYGLGRAEAQSILAERGDIEVGCEFCGVQEHFDAVDVAEIFKASSTASEPGPTLH